MQTLYIDVYFLINFSVDLLAMHFAIRLIGSYIHILRLILSCALLSITACIYALYSQGRLWDYILLVLVYFLAIRICCKKREIWKWLALSVCFLLFSFLIGGFVFWGYSKLSILFKKLNISTNNGAENKNILAFSILIFLCICVLNVLISFLERKKATKTARISFSFMNKKYQMDALVDSGCFLVEPLSNIPVFLVKKELVSIPSHLGFGKNALPEEWELKKKIRLIPASSLGKKEMLVSFLLECVEISVDHKTINLPLYLAFDEEGGTYGGCGALIPSFVLNYV